MAYFKDIKSLAKYMQTKVIPDVLANEVFETTVNIQSRIISKEVYSAYSPSVYQRRGWDGGLADPKNNVASFTYQGLGEVKMMMQNITKGKDENFYIAPLIEYGHGENGLKYQYPSYYPDGTQKEYMNPRPFTYEAIEYLKASLAHVDAMKRGLRRWGIRTT